MSYRVELVRRTIHVPILEGVSDAERLEATIAFAQEMFEREVRVVGLDAVRVVGPDGTILFEKKAGDAQGS